MNNPTNTAAVLSLSFILLDPFVKEERTEINKMGIPTALSNLANANGMYFTREGDLVYMDYDNNSFIRAPRESALALVEIVESEDWFMRMSPFEYWDRSSHIPCPEADALHPA